MVQGTAIPVHHWASHPGYLVVSRFRRLLSGLIIVGLCPTAQCQYLRTRTVSRTYLTLFRPFISPVVHLAYELVA